MKNKSQISHILSQIARMYPDIRTELDYETSFQFLIAVILSAQTTDKQVNRTTPPLFARVREAIDILNLSPEEVEKLVASVNYYKNKAKFIRASGEKLTREFGGIIPNNLKDIQSLP
jgi:endonuclease-3